MNIAKLAERLKDIPQPKLVQYAQDPNSVVPQFLALAEIQRRKKLENMNPAQPPQSTVAQDIMAQANPVGIGMPMERSGVTALPSNMGEQSFAGGGIVAFAGDEGSYVDVGQMDPETGEPYRSINPFERLAAALRSGRYERPTTTPGVYGGDADTQKNYTPSRPPVSEKTETASDKKAGVKSTAKKTEAVEAPKDPQKKLFEEYEKMLMAQGEDAKKAREESKAMRLIEAGLGIMGGTSPYAMANIGAGAIGAVKGYAQDVAGMRKEERDRIKDLASLGAKREEYAVDREKLALMDRRYKEMADIERQKIGAMYGARQDEKFINQVNQIYRADIGALKNQLGRELTDEELDNIYRNAYNRVAGAAGKGSMPGTPAAGGTIYNWKELTQPKAK